MPVEIYNPKIKKFFINFFKIKFKLYFIFKRNLNLNHINLTLREQLDQATIANQKLSQEIQKVNHEWIRLREQLENREREWRDEENVFWIFADFWA